MKKVISILVFVHLIVIGSAQMTKVDSMIADMRTDLQEAIEEDDWERVGSISKEPLYTQDGESFETIAKELLESGEVNKAERVVLLHQLARYNVAVVADFDAAFSHMMEIRRLLEEDEGSPLHPIVMADVYYLSYWIKHVQHDLKSSRNYCELLLAHAEKYGLRSMVITARMGFAELDQHSGEVQSAIDQFLSMEEEVKKMNSQHLKHRLYSLLSNAYKDLDKPAKSAHYASKAYHFIDPNNLPLLAHSSIQIARGFLDAGKVDSARFWAERGLEFAKKTGYKKEEKDVNLILVDVFKTQEDFEKAFKHLERFMQMDKEQSSLESAANIANLEKELEEERHRAEVLEKDEEVAVKDAELEKQQLRMFLLGAVLLLVGVSLFVSVRSYRLKKRDAQIIAEQRDLVEEKNKEILDSINYAKRLQNAILPSPKLVKEYLQESFILYKPKDIVAGDFYWMEARGDSIFYAAADCTGHGVPGAMVSVVCANALNKAVSEEGITDPAQILDRTRDLVVEHFGKSGEDIKDGMDISLVKLDDRMLEFAGANNPLWVIRKGSQEIEEIRGDKQPIGKFERSEPFTNHRLNVEEGDQIYVFSDGYADQFGGEKGKKFKSSNLKKLLLSVSDKEMKDQLQELDRHFEDWKGDMEQLDDVCLIGVRI